MFESCSSAAERNILYFARESYLRSTDFKVDSKLTLHTLPFGDKDYNKIDQK